MSRVGQLMKNVSFNWIGMAVSLVLGFIQAPIVVNGLGNTWFGIWVLINQVVGYTWLFDLGIREAVVRHVSKHHARKEFDEINGIVSSAIYLYLIISVLTVIVLSAVTYLLPHLFRFDPGVVGTARLVLFIGGMNIAINWFFNAYVGILMGLQRFDIFQKIGVALGLAGFALTVSVIKAGYGIVALSLINLSIGMVSNALIYWNCRRLLPEFRLLRYDRKKMQFRLLINYGKYVFLNNIGEKIIFGADVVIIGIFMQASAITFYSIPGTLITMLRSIIASAVWVMNPFFSALEANDEMERLKSIFKKATKWSLLVGLPIGIVFLFMGKNFISLWMGKDYGEGSNLVLIILTLGTIFTIWEKLIGSVLYGISRHHIIAWLRVTEAAIKIVLCIVLVERWGIVGVALGSTLPHILFMGVILPVFVCRNLNIPVRHYLRESILPPFLSSIPFAVCSFLIDLYLPAANLFIFFLLVSAIMPVFIASAWYIALNAKDREELAGLVSRYIPCLRIAGRQGIQ